MSKPVSTVYPVYHKEGVRFQLYNNGVVTARTKDLPEREVFRLSFEDSGQPWMPSHKNFNALCRQSFREGDVDDLIAEQRQISELRGLKRKYGEELYEAIIALREDGRWVGDAWIPSEDAERKADAAIAKARGES